MKQIAGLNKGIFFGTGICLFLHYLVMTYWLNAVDCLLGGLIFLTELFCMYRLARGKASDAFFFVLLGFNQGVALLPLLFLETSGKRIAYAVLSCLLFALCEFWLVMCRRRGKQAETWEWGERQARFFRVFLLLLLLGGGLALAFRFLPKNVFKITEVEQENVTRASIAVVYADRRIEEWEISGREPLEAVFRELEQVSCCYRPARLDGQLSGGGGEDGWTMCIGCKAPAKRLRNGWKSWQSGTEPNEKAKKGCRKKLPLPVS